MDKEVWYPSVIALGPEPGSDEDRMMVAGGTHLGNDVNSYQVWRPQTASVQGSWQQQSASLLKRRAPIQVVFQDERYSSVQAERLLRESGKRPSRDKRSVDSAAAAIILQSYLDSRKSSPG